MAKTIIGVMGGGESAPPHAVDEAYQLGALIAAQGWVLLCGGRNVGVMDAAARGAQEAGGLTVGILPDADTGRASAYLDIPITTGMGSARNIINVLSSDVVIACAGGAGTLSEIALALKSGKPVITLNHPTGDLFAAEQRAERLIPVATPLEAIQLINNLLES